MFVALAGHCSSRFGGRGPRPAGHCEAWIFSTHCLITGGVPIQLSVKVGASQLQEAPLLQNWQYGAKLYHQCNAYPRPLLNQYQISS